jgi:hypothetical protein
MLKKRNKFVLVILLVLSIIFIGSLNTKALELDEAEYNSLDLTFTYSGNAGGKAFYYSNVLNTVYNGKRQFVFNIQGVTAHSDSKIQYANSVFTPLATEDYEGPSWYFVNQEYNYFRFYLVFTITTNIDELRMTLEGSILPAVTYLSISDGIAVSSSAIQDAYQQGFDDAIGEGYMSGYDNGYLAGYNHGKDFMLEEAFSGGFEGWSGYDWMFDENSFPYAQGRLDGLNEAGDIEFDLVMLIPTIIGSMFGLIWTIGTYELMGMSAVLVLGIMSLFAGVILLIKMARGG